MRYSPIPCCNINSFFSIQKGGTLCVRALTPHMSTVCTVIERMVAPAEVGHFAHKRKIPVIFFLVYNDEIEGHSFEA
jgi:hypothetical protein